MVVWLGEFSGCVQLCSKMSSFDFQLSHSCRVCWVERGECGVAVMWLRPPNGAPLLDHKMMLKATVSSMPVLWYCTDQREDSDLLMLSFLLGCFDQSSGAVWKRGGHPGFPPVRNSPYGLCGHKATSEERGMCLSPVSKTTSKFQFAQTLVMTVTHLPNSLSTRMPRRRHLWTMTSTDFRSRFSKTHVQPNCVSFPRSVCWLGTCQEDPKVRVTVVTR